MIAAINPGVVRIEYALRADYGIQVRMSGSIADLRAEIEGFYRSLDTNVRNTQYAGHWWDHVSRVVRNVVLLCDSEHVETERVALIAAALCHDLVLSSSPDDGVRQSAARCRTMMLSHGFSQSDAAFASSLILATDRDVKTPSTIPERLIYIADKLDLFGIDGTIRLLLQESKAESITVRDELSERVRDRQERWIDLMRSFGVGGALITERIDASAMILASLGQIDLSERAIP